jgi:hypothetical protein
VALAAALLITGVAACPVNCWMIVRGTATPSSNRVGVASRAGDAGGRQRPH